LEIYQSYAMQRQIRERKENNAGLYKGTRNRPLVAMGGERGQCRCTWRGPITQYPTHRVSDGEGIGDVMRFVYRELIMTYGPHTNLRNFVIDRLLDRPSIVLTRVKCTIGP
jgi:hypothetical protein